LTCPFVKSIKWVKGSIQDKIRSIEVSDLCKTQFHDRSETFFILVDPLQAIDACQNLHLGRVGNFKWTSLCTKENWAGISVWQRGHY